MSEVWQWCVRGLEVAAIMAVVGAVLLGVVGGILYALRYQRPDAKKPPTP